MCRLRSIATFKKNGLEIHGLGVFVPSIIQSSRDKKEASPVFPASSPSSPAERPASVKEPRKTPFGFGKLFKPTIKKDESISKSQGSTPTSAADSQFKFANLFQSSPRADSTFGMTPSNAEAFGQSGHVQGYTWTVKRWAKVGGECSATFEWRRHKHRRATNKDGAQDERSDAGHNLAVPSVRSKQSLDYDNRSASLASPDSEDDPEDSEIPWSCTMIYANTRLHIGTFVPAPHHPKLIGQIKVPFKLPDVTMTTQEALNQYTSTTLPGVALQQGRRMVGAVTESVVEGVNLAFANLSSTKTQSAAIDPSKIEGQITLSAEDLKDILCCTSLWVVVCVFDSLIDRNTEHRLFPGPGAYRWARREAVTGLAVFLISLLADILRICSIH